jgi:hypothetical protein
MGDRVITTTGVAGEPGPSLTITVKKDGTVVRTLVPPPMDPTMGAAAIIIATQTADSEQQEED